MGYTHYWDTVKELPREGWALFCEDVKRILANLPEQTPSAGGYYADEPLVIWREGDLPGSKPLITSAQVWFNGGGGQMEQSSTDRSISDLSHETFHVERVSKPLYKGYQPDEDGFWFHFCKTARKPYDLAVTACLIRLAYRFPEGVRISSDGNEDEWAEGLLFCQQLFGYARLPFRDETPTTDAAD